MSLRAKKLARARLDLPAAGRIELSRDWHARHPPPLVLAGPARVPWASFARIAEHRFGFESGYFVSRHDLIHFVLRIRDVPIDGSGDTPEVYLAGDFNGWAAAGEAAWRLLPAVVEGEPVLLWTGPAHRFFADPWMRFKFVTGEQAWLAVPAEAPNLVVDPQGNWNRGIDPVRTGHHLFEFTLAEPLPLSETWHVSWSSGDEEVATVPLMPGRFFPRLAAEGPLGAHVHGETTHFRVFAPRARSVELRLCSSLDDRDAAPRRPLLHRDDGSWEITVPHNAAGWYYWYHIDGPQDTFGLFLRDQPVVDPYAPALVSREGPGVVLPPEALHRQPDGFVTPAWHDLVMAEAHVRDLVELAPGVRRSRPRGFAELAAWVRSPDFYLAALGVNAVELQPVQEFDSRHPDEYHWGYMTVNYFAPASAYSSAPERASGVRELQDLVAAFHERGIAVIVDVVFNHVGEPAHLMFVDKLYYFEQGSDGQLSNWSGCGNDLRAGSAMSRRLIIDACLHLLRVYGVDGFRFDLAELLGVEVLRQIEVALKSEKPDVVLIAEPWSFRGHVAAELRDTGWASWNDGFRDFLRVFARGGGSRGSYEYFLKGSPWHFAKWPAQTVNYTESHDDRTWIDVITDNPGYDGFEPTPEDRRRTHLMIAVLMMSVGIPMLSQGQDFLRSKRGVSNTYQRGDLNALEYRRILRYPGTHAYTAAWIRFRRGDRGRLVRHYSRVSEGFFTFFFAPDSVAAATLYNADLSLGRERLLFAVNPTPADVMLPLGPVCFAGGGWRMVADSERFFDHGAGGMPQRLEEKLFMPALSCGLWLSES